MLSIKTHCKNNEHMKYFKYIQAGCSVKNRGHVISWNAARITKKK